MARRLPRRGISDRLTDADDKDFIDLARKRWQQATEADKEQRVRELEDLEFYAGHQWPQEILNSREGGQQGNQTNTIPPLPPRPSLTVANLREPVRTVLNSEKDSELGISIVAADDFGDGVSSITENEIKLREGLVRRIQRESQAANARSWAFSRATIAGRGFYAVMTRFVPGKKTFDQEVYVHRFFNQAAVTIDPAHEQPDGSDAAWGFVGTDLAWDRYKAEYGTLDDEPNAVTSLSDGEWRALGDELPGWFQMTGEQRSVRIVEYWYTDYTETEIVEIDDGAGGTKVVSRDELPDGVKPLVDPDTGEERRRRFIEKQIKWAKLDGVQVLEETEWPGHYIPIVKVIGEELHPYNGKRCEEGMVRPARDGCRAVNVLSSKMVEKIGYWSMTPWSMADGQDEGFEKEYELSATRTVPVLHYKQLDSDMRPAPPPQRLDVQAPDIQPIIVGMQMFQQTVKSTLGVPDVTNLQPQIKSDRQLKRVLTQSESATSHYLDNLATSIRYEGLIINDLLYPIYGSQPGRLARMMTPDGETLAVPVGQHFIPHPKTKHPIRSVMPGPNGQYVPAANGNGMPVTPDMPGAQQYTLTPDATFNITVKVTKNYDTRRQEQESTLSTLVETDPQQMAIVGDLLFKYNDGPGHEELEDRYKAVLDPRVAALLSGAQGPDPEKQQLQQQVQQLQQAIQSKTAEKQAEVQAKGEIDLVRDAMENSTKIEIARINQEGAFAVADLRAGLEAANQAIAAMQEERKAFELSFKASHEAGTQARDHLHDVRMAVVDHAHALQQGQQAHAQALELGVQQQAAQAEAQASNPGQEGQ